MDQTSNAPAVVRLTGYITQFRCKREGFAVARFRVRDDEGRQHQELTIVGNGLSEFTERDPIDIRGQFEDSKFGPQLKVSHAFRSKPVSGSEWVSYLVQYIAGIGPSRAKAMVKQFGDKLEETLDKTPDKLFDMPGMAKKTAEKIIASWNDDRANRGVGLLLSELGLSSAIGRRVIDHFGSQTERIVRQSPYELTQVPGIGFKRADEIARHFGVGQNSPERARAVIRYVVEEEAGSSGHVFVAMGRLLELAAKEGVDTALVRSELPKIIKDPKHPERPFELIQEEIPQNGVPPVPVLFLKSLHRAEVRVAKSVKRLLTATPLIQHSTVQIEAALEHAQSDRGLTLNTEQRMAIRNAVTLCLSIVTGKAGTGKTTVLQILVKVAELLNVRFVLAAPTGRAAKRMTEVTGQPATTIHRLLEWNPETKGFMRTRMNPLDADLVIIDEFSMVDLQLAADVLDAVRTGASVLVLGDPNQLMSVGAGRVLADFIDSAKITRTDLHQIFRQAQQSLIVTNAHKVLNGALPVFHRDTVRSGPLTYDCYHVDAPLKAEAEKGRKSKPIDPPALMELLTDFATKKIPSRLSFDPIRDLQVLVPQKKGAVGVHEINHHLQAVLNPRKEHDIVQINGRQFRVGDRVMQIKNNNKLEIYNGDIGFVESFDREDKVLVVQFPIKRLEYQWKDCDELHLAYAVTVHKCVAGYSLLKSPGVGLRRMDKSTVNGLVWTGQSKQPVLDVIATGKKPIVRITTAAGYSIDVSAEHPLLTADESGEQFTVASDLVIGQHICIDRQLVTGRDLELPSVSYESVGNGAARKRLHLPATLTTDLAWMIGVIVGDGCCTDIDNGTIEVINQSLPLRQRFQTIAESYGLAVGTDPTEKYHTPRVYFSSKPFRELLFALGLGYNRARGKSVPEALYEATAEVRGAFLQGLFDTDGSVRSKARMCILATSSTQLAMDAQQLLLSLGLISRRKFLPDSDSWQVLISGNAVELFRDRIGFSVPEKHAHLPKRGRFANRTLVDLIPFGGKLRQELLSSMSAGQEIDWNMLYPKQRARIAYHHLADLVDRCKRVHVQPPSLAVDTLRKQFFYDTVSRVELLEDEVEMWDIEVNEHHAFVANGFVCHNSQGSEFPVVIMPLLTEHWIMLQRNLLYTAMTRSKKLLLLITTPRALQQAVENNEAQVRNSMLIRRIRGLLKAKTEEAA